MKYKNVMPLNLQFFAEPPEGDEPEDQKDPDRGNPDPEGNPDDDKKPLSFDELLKDKSYQSEYDRRIQKALETQRTKYEALMDDKLSESEKLSKMSEKEKERYLQQKKEKELEEKEAGITRRELLADAKSVLADKGVPVGLADFLNYKDKEACDSSLENLCKLYSESVAKGIEDAIKGGKPMKKAPGTDSEHADEEQKILKAMQGF